MRSTPTKSIKNFPQMFTGSPPGMFSIPDGWMDLFDTLVDDLKAHSEAHDLSIYAVQAKEKFGELRLYVNGADSYSHELISAAIRKSAKTCVTCGAEGEIINRNGWISPFCPAHSNPENVVSKG